MMDSPYYDEQTPQCETCGWWVHDSFPDGKPYDACGWWGYIQHKKTDLNCPNPMSPQGVADYLARAQALANKRRRK